MPTVITWNDGVAPATEFTISDAVMASLLSQCATMTTVQNGQLVQTYTGAGTAPVQAWLVALFSQQIVSPALANFPPVSVQTALADLQTAQAALAAAQAATIPGFVPAS